MQNTKTQMSKPFIDRRMFGRNIEAKFVLARSKVISKTVNKFPDRVIESSLVYDDITNCLSIIQKIEFSEKTMCKLLTLIDTHCSIVDGELKYTAGFRYDGGFYQAIGNLVVNNDILKINIIDKTPFEIEFKIDPTSVWLKPVQVSKQQNNLFAKPKESSLLSKQPKIQVIDDDNDDDNDFSVQDLARLRGQMPITRTQYQQPYQRRFQPVALTKSW